MPDDLDVGRAARGGAKLAHGMIRFVTLGSKSQEETIVAKVKIEALEAVVAEADDGEDFACFALGVVGGQFRCTEPVQNGQPDKRLRFFLQPFQELLAIDRVRRR